MLEPKIYYYIVCHDPRLIDECEKSVSGKLPGLQYVLVGRQPYSSVLDREKMIVCNELSDNIEHLPNLCSFTAWYAIRKNRLPTDGYVCLLEYDSKVGTNFDSINKRLLSEQTNNRFMLGYLKAPVDHPVFLKSTPWLEISLRQELNIDLASLVACHKQKNPFWITTTNVTIPWSIFSDFVDWYLPLTKTFARDPWGVFVQERALYVYSVLHHLEIKFSEVQILDHAESKSHGLVDLYGDFLKLRGSGVFNHEMESDYDVLYRYFIETMTHGSS